MCPIARVDVTRCYRVRGSLAGKFLVEPARLVFALVVLGVTIGLTPPVRAQSQAAPEAASGFARKSALATRRYVAVTANPLATKAAVDVLRRGGNAMDAALAAQMVLNVVEPQSSGIGGGGFLLYFDANAKKIYAHDGRETAPASATADRFLDVNGNPKPFREVVATGTAVGVPGLVAMLADAHRAHGRLPWAELVEPAIRLARDGFPVSPRLHALLAADRHLARGTAAAVFLDSQGLAWPVGHRLRQPDLADSLRRVAAAGQKAIRNGPLADAIVGAVKNGGGDLGHNDLERYEPRRREAACGSYRGYRICGMPPPSSGGIAVLELLGILERTPFATAPPMSAAAVHWFSEAGRLAYADRNRYLGDPDFVTIPQDELLAGDYLAERAHLIAAERSLGVAPFGNPAKVSPGGTALKAIAEAPELPATTHISIVDADGNAVALTSSIENAFGSRIMTKGFLLNNQLTDFSFVPGGANQVAPGKRPLSSMAPTLVFDPDGKLFAVLGSPGGSRIINYVARTLVALIDWKLAPDLAVTLPHFGSRNGATELEAVPETLALQGGLAARGHVIMRADMTSGLHLVVRSGHGWLGAADPRREGNAAGE